MNVIDSDHIEALITGVIHQKTQLPTTVALIYVKLSTEGVVLDYRITVKAARFHVFQELRAVFEPWRFDMEQVRQTAELMADRVFSRILSLTAESN